VWIPPLWGAEERAQYAKSRAGGIRQRADLQNHGLVGSEQREQQCDNNMGVFLQKEHTQLGSALIRYQMCHTTCHHLGPVENCRE
jgi:hypothetical protein